ncbi:PH domain-containing protein [Psychroflexus sp. MES1-P1E]|uniref:PH domain-containing protein n=1 Tax=Psychroflexus sp. MES1-P1E TaxID=2058320 RepID=UPI000C7E4F9B|nr:hypothetical protein CXF67_02570 [Psychroflexus sp. MES1-P1E]
MEINDITNSNTIIFSPTASFERIEIKYEKFKEMIISPKNKLEFAKYLTNLNPKITGQKPKKKLHNKHPTKYSTAFS